MIPCKQLGAINPGYLFGEYMKYLPDGGTIEGKGGYLFPKPKEPSKKFDVHTAGEMNLYQPNQPGGNLIIQLKVYEISFYVVGRNMIADMLPLLCEVIERPRATNHMVR